MTLVRRLIALALALTLALCGPAAPAADGAAHGAAHGEARLRWEQRSANRSGPLAAADALAPGLAPPPADAAVAELELAHTLHAAGSVLSLGLGLLAAHRRPEGGPGLDTSRVNELHLNWERGAWAASAGRRVVAWDVGHGFRPNDMVQQEERRTLAGLAPQGRPLLQLEYFGSESAAALVWVNPNRHGDGLSRQRGADEPALALRGYWQLGALDLHGFARAGEHTRASLGAALAWVAGDALELHASLRVLQRHDGWAVAAAADDAVIGANPWSQTTRGGAAQALVGFGWTGAARQSLIVEAWHDGTAPSDAAWRSWHARNAALVGSGAPAAARAGNLAWQATPLNGGSLRRDNLFVRLAWEPERWQLSADALLTPADGGRILTAALQWRGERWRLEAALRRYGGRGGSVIAQLPLRQQSLVMLGLMY